MCWLCAHSVGDDTDDGISALWIVIYLEVVVSTRPHHRGLRSLHTRERQREREGRRERGREREGRERDGVREGERGREGGREGGRERERSLHC